MPPFHPRPLPRKPLSQATAAPIGLIGSVGDREENDPADLSQLARALGRLGDYRPEDYGRTHDEPAVWNGALVGALARFQERERLLREAGFTYEPDPLGRLGQGDWRDRNGRVQPPSTLGAVLREQLPLIRQADGQTRRNESTKPSESIPSNRYDLEGGSGVETTPVLRNSGERIANVRADDPGIFFIKDDSQGTGAEVPYYEFPKYGAAVVQAHDSIIKEEAAKGGLSSELADLARAIMQVENARGWYDAINPYRESVRPMNINPRIWEGLGGITPDNADDARTNVRAGLVLIKRLWERTENPNPRKIAALWHFTGRENTKNDQNGFADRVDYVFRNKLWRQDAPEPYIPPGAP